VARELLGIGQRERVAACIALFVLYTLLISVVVTVRFLCSCVKLPSSPPIPQQGRGHRATAWSCVARRGQTMTIYLFFFLTLL